MHYHLEIILPPTDNIEDAIKQILEPFNENGEDEDGNSNQHSFWDWYVIGGRWAGAKLEAMLDKDKIKAFREELFKLGVTVSGLQSGKQELNPKSQIPMVDDLWQNHFPDLPIKVCPLFNHFNNQYENSNGFPDIMLLKDVPKELTASHVIIACPHWQDEKKLGTGYRIQDSMWNGTIYVDTKWDGNVFSAIEQYKESLTHYKPEYAAKCIPQDNWLVVTVDYHS